MCSFPYVRDWLNEHPFKNEPDARLICNLFNGDPINPKTLEFNEPAKAKNYSAIGYWRNKG